MNAVQEERMKGYFLTAAKELIRGEGLDVVSARNVAERAGYSYATLYNYFKDIRELVFSCVEDFMKECSEFVIKDLGKATGENALMKITSNYVKFFIQYPGIFDLFYQEKVNQIATGNSNVNSIDSFFNSLTDQYWQQIKVLCKHNEHSVSLAQEYHKLAINGLLMLYLNRRKDIGFKEFMKNVEELTSFSVNSFK